MKEEYLRNIKIQSLPIENRWTIHSYYTLSPYAPDGTGRILAAGVDLKTNLGKIFILSSDGKILDSFGEHTVTPSFWHTGFWQSWSHDTQYVYFQGGSEKEPWVARRELNTGREVRVRGDMEGIPPSGEPGISCEHSLLYAAGYGHPEERYQPERAIVPFQQREKHGISVLDFHTRTSTMHLSTESILQMHPERERLCMEDHKIKSRLGAEDGLTLMTYCVRWNPQGTRCLFYFGNHCVDKRRKEPKITYIFTADLTFQEIHLAVDLSFHRYGVHWSWQPDGEHLIGYGPDLTHSEKETRLCLAEVRYDGSHYLKLSDHVTEGHPSICPTNENLIITDGQEGSTGVIYFLSRHTGQVIHRLELPKFLGEQEPPGRNPLRVCHHPVFAPEGDRILCNSLPGEHATLVELHID